MAPTCAIMLFFERDAWWRRPLPAVQQEEEKKPEMRILVKTLTGSTIALVIVSEEDRTIDTFQHLIERKVEEEKDAKKAKQKQWKPCRRQRQRRFYCKIEKRRRRKRDVNKSVRVNRNGRGHSRTDMPHS